MKNTSMKNPYIYTFQEIDKNKISMVGGKSVNLGELSRIAEIRVPEGFCISTEVFKNVVRELLPINELLNQLSLLTVEDSIPITALGSEIRNIIEGVEIPHDIVEEIEHHLFLLGENDAYAIRSSATAEDLLHASFAGQQDSYLNIIGKDSVLKHIRKCWASLFTDRAIVYRIQNGFDHHNVYLSVIVQKMIFSDVAGIMFTADPVTSNRRIVSIDASFGLGEALVSGLVNADNYKVKNGRILDKKISTKALAVYALKGGGTDKHEMKISIQNQQALTDEQILELEHIGRKIEKHFCCPQDIEWCLAGNTFYIVQSRPITTLYPIPEGNNEGNHVYISVGHQQMMTDPMKPLGLSLWQLRAGRPMFKAGGRLFVDVAHDLSTLAGRKSLIEAMGQHDPLIKDALMTIVERGDFIKLLPDDEKVPVHVKSDKGIPPADILAQAGNGPEIVHDLIKHSEASVETLRQHITMKSGTDLFDFILEDIEQSKQMVFASPHMRVILAAMNASAWINGKMNEWLGEKNAADILSQSVSNNITSDMGLALLDVADAIRPHGAVIDYLQEVKDDDFLNELPKLEGGTEARDAIGVFLNKYGMRCAGEIDITKARWSEKPATLIPIILGNIKNFEHSASKRKFEEGRQQALNKKEELLDRLRQLPDGEQKASEAEQMIDLLRNFAGYREYPKYEIVNRFFAYKQALIKEIEQLVQAGVINNREDVYYLTFEEFREVVRTHQLDQKVIAERKEEHKRNKKLTPPRVITSDGEILAGQYKRANIPDGALAGLAVSSGIIEGRARVIVSMGDADIEDGDILVTSFTDPSWTPLFVSIKGLVTEVGGLMTHGAVIAREYGLPAVVGVEHATTLIKEGQRIQVNAIEGYVKIL